MKTDINLFLIKVFILSIITLAVIAIPYIYFDPFKVVHSYKCYHNSGQISVLTLNEEYVATKTLLNNGPKNYDSFIFGNSKSMFYRVADWKKYIHCSECYHYGEWHDMASGILRKLIFLKKQGCHLKNALLVTDLELISDTKGFEGNIYLKDPELSGQNALAFQISFFKDFANWDFILNYFNYILFKKVNKGFFIEGDTINYSVKYNEMERISWENEIRTNKDTFYSVRSWVRKDWQSSTSLIRERQRRLWTEIHDIFQKDSTDVRIIISPEYDEIKINREDFAFLDSLFGRNHVFNFSGINAITENKENYYDQFHYRPFAAACILDEVYSNPPREVGDTTAIFRCKPPGCQGN